MNKKGFTLTELLVVIAIIGVLSVIIIPSVVKINKSINEREYEQRKTYIESAAEMYASDKPDIFGGGDVAYVYVWQLLQENYLNADSESEETCNYKAGENGTQIEENRLGIGCVSDPRSSTSMNSQMIKLTRKTVGIVAELVDSKTTTITSKTNSARKRKTGSRKTATNKTATRIRKTTSTGHYFGATTTRSITFRTN